MFRNILLTFGMFTASMLVSTVAFGGMFDSDSSDKNHKMNEDVQDESMAFWDTGEESQIVAIDVQPNDEENRIARNGVQPFEVAILGSSEFNVSDVDPASITLGDVNSDGESRMADTNNDGFEDLIIAFVATDLHLDGDTKELTLKGKTKDGSAFKGSDKVAYDHEQQ